MHFECSIELESLTMLSIIHWCDARNPNQALNIYCNTLCAYNVAVRCGSYITMHAHGICIVKAELCLTRSFSIVFMHIGEWATHLHPPRSSPTVVTATVASMPSGSSKRISSKSLGIFVVANYTDFCRSPFVRPRIAFACRFAPFDCLSPAHIASIIIRRASKGSRGDCLV